MSAQADYEKKLAAHKQQYGEGVSGGPPPPPTQSSKPEPPQGLEKYCRLYKMFHDENKLRNSLIQDGIEKDRMQEVIGTNSNYFDIIY